MSTSATTEGRAPNGRRAARGNSYTLARWLGVLAAVMAGIANVPFGDWISGVLGQTVPYAVYLTILLAPFAMVAAISGWLLRTWWSLLTVPALFFAGYLVGALIAAGARGSLYTVEYALQYLLLGIWVFGLVQLLPVLAGAAIGTAIAKRRATSHS